MSDGKAGDKDDVIYYCYDDDVDDVDDVDDGDDDDDGNDDNQ